MTAINHDMLDPTVTTDFDTDFFVYHNGRELDSRDPVDAYVALEPLMVEVYQAVQDSETEVEDDDQEAMEQHIVQDVKLVQKIVHHTRKVFNIPKPTVDQETKQPTGLNSVGILRLFLAFCVYAERLKKTDEYMQTLQNYMEDTMPQQPDAVPPDSNNTFSSHDIEPSTDEEDD